MSGSQIDKLCTDWLRENYGQEIASEYSPDSLAIPMLNSPELNGALEALREVLCIAFGPDESFGSTEYHQARRKLGVPEEDVPVPEVFMKVFTTTSQ
jgi:hypothetical protein